MWTLASLSYMYWWRRIQLYKLYLLYAYSNCISFIYTHMPICIYTYVRCQAKNSILKALRVALDLTLSHTHSIRVSSLFFFFVSLGSANLRAYWLGEDCFATVDHFQDTTLAWHRMHRLLTARVLLHFLHACSRYLYTPKEIPFA